MGQSQPTGSAPGNVYQPKQLAKLLTKIENIRMVPIDEFQLLFEQEENVVSDDLFNEENCSIYERELPREIFVHILGYLPVREIIKVGRISTNFQLYWIQKKSLWKGILNRGSEEAPYMYFRPIIGSSMIQSLILYYNNFIPLIRNSIKRTTNTAIVVAKAAFLGSENSGKSELMNRLAFGKEFEPTYSPTVKFEVAVITYQIMNGLCIKLQCWDFAGSDQTAIVSLTRTYAKTHMLVFCFSLNEEESFENMKERVEMYRNETFADENWNENLTQSNCTLLILGMKRDLERKVSNNQIKEYISQLSKVGNDGISFKDLRIQYFEISNRTDSVDILEFPFLYAIAIQEEYLSEQSVTLTPLSGA